MNSRLYLFSFLTIALILIADLFHAWRNLNNKTTIKAAIYGIVFYISIAITFGLVVGNSIGREHQAAYFAAWLTEYTLSLDNLFVFIVIFKKFKIENEKQEILLLFGITTSLILRGIFLVLGVNLIAKFIILNIFFAGFLIYTAIKILRETEEIEWQEYRIINYLKNKGFSLFIVVLFSIAFADLMFAFDSIPAVIGITNNLFVILTANFMALMGLRQLFFVIEYLVKKLKFLYIGVSVILLFIGIKLLVHSLNKIADSNGINLNIPELSTIASFFVILFVLITSVIVSLARKSTDS